MNRRTFLRLAAAGAPGRIFSANEKLTIACMGCRGRAGHLISGFAGMREVNIATLIDIDPANFKPAVQKVESAAGKTPRTVSDFRRALDDKSIDALVVGTPDHWHAIPTILACQAGKHVYVEKPCSHNIREGQAMVAAARKYDRVVQVGIQSRNGRHLADAYEYIRSGALGKVAMAKAWESTRQRAVPPVPDSAPPQGVDYDMWLGPAPKRPFNANRFHSKWRWFFDYGTGDLGNDGVHRLDYARRGLDAAFQAMGKKLPDWPTAVTSSGGKLFFDDAQEWPDTLISTWEYPGAMLTYEMRVWSPSHIEGEAEGAAIYGENGSVVIGNGAWRAYGRKGEELPVGGKSSNEEHERAHYLDWYHAIRNSRKPACEIAIGHVASSYTHLGNISWRVGRRLRFNQATQSFIGDQEADKMLGRTYRAPWNLPKV